MFSLQKLSSCFYLNLLNFAPGKIDPLHLEFTIPGLTLIQQFKLMNKNNFHFFLLLLAALLLHFSCSRKSAIQQSSSKELNELVYLMSGDFSSAEQAEEDTSYFDISLVMRPIWKQDQNVKWLYVEQAVTQYIDKPYRQRIYRLSQVGDDTFESRVYELPDPEKYVHAFDDMALFDVLTPESLILRPGCAVFLNKKGNCYAGSTNENDCKSTLRGATYATSVVEICDSKIISWDQGWNDEDEQVWGATKGGYVFRKK